MQTIIIIILSVLLIIALWKWFSYRIALAAYLRYYHDQNAKEPTQDKLKEYQVWAVEKTIKDFFKLR